MGMWKLSALVGALVMPAVAIAQPVQGFYIGGSTGVNFAGTFESSQDLTKIHTDPGPLGLAALGWGFDNGWRAEIEGSYRSNSVGSISTLRTNGSSLPLTNAGGDANTYAVMANIAYDIPVQPLGLPIQPYIGVGLGYGWLDFDGAGGQGNATFHLANNNTVNSPDTVGFGSSSAFAYQAIVGASLPLPIPGLDLTVEYRYFGMARTDIPVARTAIGNNLINGSIPSAASRNGFEVQDNTILVGLRYAFEAS